MPDSTQEIILDELRDLRTDYNSFAPRHRWACVRPGADVHGLIGNGRPGRVNRLESSVQIRKQWRWWLVGEAAGGGGVISVLTWVVTEERK
jgi:hypothetical protein